MKFEFSSEEIVVLKKFAAYMLGQQFPQSATSPNEPISTSPPPLTKKESAEIALAPLSNAISKFSISKSDPALTSDMVLQNKFKYAPKATLLSRLDPQMEDLFLGRLTEVAINHVASTSTNLEWFNDGHDLPGKEDFQIGSKTIDVKATIDDSSGKTPNSSFKRGLMLRKSKVNVDNLADIVMLYSVWEDAVNFHFKCRGWIPREEIIQRVDDAINFTQEKEYVYAMGDGLFKVKTNCMYNL